jgi:hypothetical protein
MGSKIYCTEYVGLPPCGDHDPGDDRTMHRDEAGDDNCCSGRSPADASPCILKGVMAGLVPAIPILNRDRRDEARR